VANTVAPREGRLTGGLTPGADDVSRPVPSRRVSTCRARGRWSLRDHRHRGQCVVRPGSRDLARAAR